MVSRVFNKRSVSKLNRRIIPRTILLFSSLVLGICVGFLFFVLFFLSALFPDLAHKTLVFIRDNIILSYDYDDVIDLDDDDDDGDSWKKVINN